MASYVVNWQGADSQGWHPVADVSEATAYVEHLRNSEGVEQARIFRLDEVPFEFRPYFKVELATPATSFAASIAPEPLAAPVIDAVLEHVPERVPDDETPVEATSRRGLFGR